MRIANTPQRSSQSRRRRSVANRARRVRPNCAPMRVTEIERFKFLNPPKFAMASLGAFSQAQLRSIEPSRTNLRKPSKIRLASLGAFSYSQLRSIEPSRTNLRKPSKIRLASLGAFSLRAWFLRTYDDGSRRFWISDNPRRIVAQLLASVRSPRSAELEFTIGHFSRTRRSDWFVSLEERSDYLTLADRETFVRRSRQKCLSQKSRRNLLKYRNLRHFST